MTLNEELSFLRERDGAWQSATGMRDPEAAGKRIGSDAMEIMRLRQELARTFDRLSAAEDVIRGKR